MENSKDSQKLNWGTKKEWQTIVLLIFLIGFLVHIPTLFKLDSESYFIRNIGLILFLPLTLYLIWYQKAELKQTIIPLLIISLGTAYLNGLDGDENHPPFFLSCVHMIVLFWGAYAFTSLRKKWSSNASRVSFLRQSGDHLLLIGLIILGGVLFSLLAVGLFALIGFEFSAFYFQHIAPWGLAVVPVLALFILLHNLFLVDKVSSLIATLFTPFALLTLVLFSASLPFAEASVFKDRSVLLLFNIILFAILGLILFSLSGSKKSSKKKGWVYLLICLAVVCLIDNIIALSAIGYRMLNFGLSANRLAILGLNVIVSTHLASITVAMIRLKKMKNYQSIENKIGAFFPIYLLWVGCVAFLFPIFF